MTLLVKMTITCIYFSFTFISTVICMPGERMKPQQGRVKDLPHSLRAVKPDITSSGYSIKTNYKSHIHHWHQRELRCISMEHGTIVLRACIINTNILTFSPIILEGWKTTEEEPFRKERILITEKKTYLIPSFCVLSHWDTIMSGYPVSMLESSLLRDLTCKKKYKIGYLYEASRLIKN